MHNSRERIPIPKGGKEVKKEQIGAGYLHGIRAKIEVL